MNDSLSLFIKEGSERRTILKDLSARGAGIIGDSHLEINGKITTIINAPFFFDRPICRQATIVWCQKLDNNLWRGGLDFGIDNKIEIL